MTTDDRDMTMAERIAAITQGLLPEEYFLAERIVRQAEQQIAALAIAPAALLDESDPFETGEISSSWIDQQIHREDTATRVAKQRKALEGLMSQARGRVQSIHQAQCSRILGAFNQELRELLCEVEGVSDELGSVDTAQAAIANDLGLQWKRLTELAADYAELRRAQHHLMPPEVVHSARAAFGEQHASDLYLKNLDDLWPTWRNPGQGKERVIHINGAEQRYEPWPQDPNELLLWLVRSDARAWIPTEQQLRQLQEHRVARRNPNPRVIQERPDLMNRRGTQTANRMENARG